MQTILRSVKKKNVTNLSEKLTNNYRQANRKKNKFFIKSIFAFIAFIGIINVNGWAQQVTDTYSTPGTATFFVPAGVSSLTVECWGGGGQGGAAATVNPAVGGGGSGGAYTKGTFTTFAPGTTVTITIGAGGSGANLNGDPGTVSWFGSATTIKAVGGNGGNGSNNTTPGTGAAAVNSGNVNTGTSITNTYGTAGTTGTALASGVGGTGGNGGSGGAAQTGNAAGNPGMDPSGGGGGARRTNQTRAGGAGGDGQVKITYTLVPVTYYSKSTGNLNVLTTWGTNTDGSGIAPANFTNPSQTYIIANRTTATIAAAWTVSGSGSKVINGDGNFAPDFTIPSGFAFTGTIDVAANATLTDQNATVPTLGSLAATSTVDFASTSAQSIPVVTFGNLKVSGSRGSNDVTFLGAVTIMGDLTISANGNAGAQLVLNNSNTSRTFTINGDYIQSGYEVEFGASGSGATIINLAGDFSKTGGYMVTTVAGVPNGLVNLNGTVQNVQSNGGTTIKWVDFKVLNGSVCSFNGTFNTNGSSGTNALFTVNTGGTLNCNNFNLIGAANVTQFILSGTLGIGSAAGITTAGNAAGNIQTAVRTFNTTANYMYNGAAAQVTGNGLPTSLTGNLTINNSSGVTLSQATSDAGIFTLTNGILTTSTNLLSITNTATSAVVGGSATSFIRGPLNRTLPAGLTSSSNVYNYPVGAGTNYLPYSITTVNTGATSPVLQVTAFASASGGTPDNTTISGISNTEYWQTKVLSGNYSGASLSLTRQTAVGPAFDVIAKGQSTTTAATSYSSLGGAVSGNSVIGSNQTGTIAVGASQFNVFGKTSFNIISSSDANGTVTPPGSTNVTKGGSQTYTITPNACYSIATVLVDGVNNPAAVSSGTYTFTNVTAAHTISATFSLNAYTITSGAGTNGSISPNGSMSVNCGSNQSFTITPNACYSIATVLVDGVNNPAAVSSGTYTFTNVTAAHTISATFSLKSYTVTSSAGANGSISPNGATSVNCGTNQSYTITPASSCYSIATVLVDGVNNPGAVTSGTYTFTNVTAAHTISATFSLNTYAITSGAGANGTISPNGSTSVNCGSSQTYTITADACYAIATVLVDGVNNPGAVSSGTYTFTNVTAAHTISATFSLKSYTITSSAGANGTISPNGSTSINCGSSQAYTITPGSCYSIATVLVDGVNDPGAVSSGTYTFSNVITTHTISVTFSLNTYTITATAGANGTVTPAGATTVNCGSNNTYTITPAACYSITDVLVDGVSVGAVSTYTFTNTTANHTISASFAINTNTITATSGVNGTVTPAGVTTVNCGSNSTTYTITPDACYSIADVLVDGVSVGAVAAYTFTNTTANHTISATFAISTYTITATSGANGTVTPAGVSTVNCGSNYTYTITPGACNSIATVLVDGVNNPGAVSSGTYAFTNVTANHTISATFINKDIWLVGAGDWNTGSNWSCGVPALTTNVTIPNGGQPLIDAATAPALNSVHNIDIQAGASLTLTYTGTDTAVLKITGSYNNGGVLVNSGKIILNGDVAQSFPGGSAATVTINALEIDNALGVTINKPVIITGLLVPTAGTIDLVNNNITLHSDVNHTAAIVGQIPASQIPAVNGEFKPFIYSGTGRFKVEQFIQNRNTYAGEPVGRSYRLMTAPLVVETTTTGLVPKETIKKAWQDGRTNPPDSYTPGIGTLITGPGTTSNGFDGTNASPSLKYYNSSLQLVTVPNTTSYTISNGSYSIGGQPANQGYYMFVRGDRNPNNLNVAYSNSTTLTATGKLQTGSMVYTPPAATNAAGSFILLANPYAAPIDFNKVYLNGNTKNINREFFAWNPKKNNYAGGYTTISYNTNTLAYDNSDIDDPTTNQTQDIQSNQAVFVITKTSPAGAPTIGFDENEKSSVYKYVFRPSSSSAIGSLRVNLFTNSSNVYADGALIQYNSAYSNDVDTSDAVKLPNPKENIAILRAGRSLSIERRSMITTEDTVFLNLWNTAQTSYRFDFIADGFNPAGLTGYLEDSYLKVSTPVNMSGTTPVNFSISAEPASATANRFRIVFRPSAPLPVTFTNVKAYQQGGNVNVEWTVENESGMKEYELEKSSDGSHFTKIATTSALHNNGIPANYVTPDAGPFNGANYYRIKSISKSGEDHYSNIVRVTIGRGKPGFSVYPNPVVNETINLQITNQPTGSYSVRLMNKLGQVLMTKEIKHQDGSSTETLQLSKAVAHGMYQLEVSAPGKVKNIVNVMY